MLEGTEEYILTSTEVEQATDLAVELAVQLGEKATKMEPWRASFQLARRLRQVSRHARPEQFERAVMAFAERAGRPFVELWWAFLDCWDRVRFAEGDDLLNWAAEQARREPLATDPRLGVPYQFVASLAWHLAEHQQGEPFLLPLDRVAALLKTDKMTVSRIIKRLKKDGFVREVKAHRFTEGKAKEYALGEQPICDLRRNAA